MPAAYVDTSYLVAIALREPGSARLARNLANFSDLLSANLLAAEFASAMLREGAEPAPELTDQIQWVLPMRALEPEIARVLDGGYLRGADCWHLACALHVADNDPGSLAFLTLDTKQRAAAARLGFLVS